MTNPEAAAATQIKNIERATGRTVPQWHTLVAGTGLTKHGQIVSYLKTEHGLTHGNANALAHKIRELAAGGPASANDLLEAQYRGTKAGLRPIYDELVLSAQALGDDVTVSIKKTGVSLRRSKQFALIEPKSAKRVELGLNLEQTPPTDRLRAAGGMCTHRVALTDVAEVDDEVAGWLRAAYEQS
ncbi:DUF4287 domain-containing protein [Kibdelosporangium aridum]|uniref:DUF4287 domain-containing protein n=1 Tax=Kibdelosporangium aridum TaxID=2030 RepID=UPI0021ADCC29|nr:DUF4287 domain-containing protein [Kibdelosporangium aridum]